MGQEDPEEDLRHDRPTTSDAGESQEPGDDGNGQGDDQAQGHIDPCQRLALAESLDRALVARQLLNQHIT
jgi:hypothetical protein